MTCKLPPSLTFPRAVVVLLGLCIAYVGFEELRLRIVCWSPQELSLASLTEAAASGPVWATVEAVVPNLDTVTVTTETGNSQSAWIPLLVAPDARVVTAVLASESAGQISSLRGKEAPVRLEVLAHPARAAERSAMASSLGALGLRAGQSLVVLELDRRPASLLAGLFYLTLGIGLAAASLLGVRLPLPRLRSWPAAVALNGEPHVLPDLEIGPLPEDVKVDVHHMLDDVWTGVRSAG